jgi:MFS transporter, PHS family, inorganic phosphate transporter
LKETPRFLHASGQQEDTRGKLIRAEHFNAKRHSVSFWDGFHRLVNDNKLLSRLIGVSLAWFLMDFAYYGNTVSSPLVLSALGAHNSLLKKTLTQLVIFAVFAAPGYLASILAMDKLGRKTIQCLGFAMMAFAFGAMALVPNIESQATLFVVIYGISFFFTEFGPNATTFVYPSEVFPVRVRSTGHGIAAALGKLGGFLGVFTFPFLMHWHGLLTAECSAAVVSLLGLVATLALLPETKGKSLEEISVEPESPLESAQEAA